MIKIKSWWYSDDIDSYIPSDFYVDPNAIVAIKVLDNDTLNGSNNVVNIKIQYPEDSDKIMVCATQNVDQIISDIIRAKGYPTRSIRKEAV